MEGPLVTLGIWASRIWTFWFYNSTYNIRAKHECLWGCKGWFCSSTASFMSESAPTLPWSIHAPYHPVRLLSYMLLLAITVFSAPFFLTGAHLCNIPFPIPSNLFLPSTVSLIFQPCIPVPIAHPVLFQKPVLSYLVLLFLFPQDSLYSFPTIHTYCLFSQCIHWLLLFSASSLCPSQIRDLLSVILLSF